MSARRRYIICCVASHLVDILNTLLRYLLNNEIIIKVGIQGKICKFEQCRYAMRTTGEPHDGKMQWIQTGWCYNRLNQKSSMRMKME